VVLTRVNGLITAKDFAGAEKIPRRDERTTGCGTGRRWRLWWYGAYSVDEWRRSWSNASSSRRTSIRSRMRHWKCVPRDRHQSLRSQRLLERKRAGTRPDVRTAEQHAELIDRVGDVQASTAIV